MPRYVESLGPHDCGKVFFVYNKDEVEYSLFDTVWMDLVFALHLLLLNLCGDASILSKRLQEIHAPVSKMQHCDWRH